VSCWVDDYVFSGERAREGIEIAYEVLGKLGLRINRNKTRIMRRGRAAQEATGLVMNAGVSLGQERFRAYRRATRAAMRAAASGAVTEHQLAVVRGHYAFARMVNRRQAMSLDRQGVGLPEHGLPGGRPPPRLLWAPCPPDCPLGHGMPRRGERPEAA
jgi:hypothetical protein